MGKRATRRNRTFKKSLVWRSISWPEVPTYVVNSDAEHPLPASEQTSGRCQTTASWDWSPLRLNARARKFVRSILPAARRIVRKLGSLVGDRSATAHCRRHLDRQVTGGPSAMGGRTPLAVMRSICMPGRGALTWAGGRGPRGLSISGCSLPSSSRSWLIRRPVRQGSLFIASRTIPARLR